MSGELPFFIEGRLVEIISSAGLALVKVPNGNIYHLHPETPGINFKDLQVGQIIKLEVITTLTRVLSAQINNQ